jgi:integrase
MPLPKTLRRQIPLMLSADEVARLIEAAPNLRRSTLMTLYSTGMRCAELCRLRPEDVDKKRMVNPHSPRQRRQAPRGSLEPKTARPTAHVLPFVEAPHGCMFPCRQLSRPTIHYRQDRVARLPNGRASRRYHQAHA